jgi:serine/threonine-protein kinase
LKAAEIEHWNEAQKLLDDVLEAPGPGTVAVARTRAATAGCINELEALLKALDTVSVLDAPLDDAISEIAAAQLRHGALSGRVFGRWTLGEEIGRGGMSTVYLARRTGDGFEQQAALKILSLTFASQALIDSFLRERKILSELQHPGIARLIDGGVTPEGSPFLVMDYVDGLRIDHWCAEHGADATAVVRLVEALARAVAHAQRLLVIHRDINAANVLINRRGEPVLIDFGIAGLLDSDRGHTLHAFTPTFAAPEQIAGALCTTATDVYAIGRLLDSLLPEGMADNDLRLLIDVATAEDPERRYANARSLAEDLQAWLEMRPMRARPPSIRYRTARFVARHRWGVAAGVLALLSMAGGFTASLWQAHIAATERDLAQIESTRATQVTEFLKDLFRASDPDRARGEALTARELLDQGAYQARNAFELTPELKVEMLVLLGDLYRELDELEAAEPLLQDALALAQSLNGTPQIVDALRAMALLKMNSQDHEEALALAERAEQLLVGTDAIPGRQHAMLLQPMLFSLAELGRAEEAVTRGEVALENARGHTELPAPALYSYLYDLANVLVIAERESEAEPLLLEAMNLDMASSNNPTTQIALLSGLASIADEKGEIDAALNYLHQAIELTELIYPSAHSERARILSSLAVEFNKFGRYPEAEQASREALDIYAAIYGEEAHPRVAAAHNNLGRALSLQGKYEDAAVQSALARNMAGELFGHNDPRYAIATGNLGDMQRRAGRFDEADELLQLNLELRRSILGSKHRTVGTGLALLALLRVEQGRHAEALALCDEALALFEHIEFENPVALIVTRVRRARALAGLGRSSEAEAEFADLLRMTEAVGADAGAARLDLLAAHAEYLLERADPEAQAAIEEALEAHVETLGASHPDTQRLVALSRTPLAGSD